MSEPRTLVVTVGTSLFSSASWRCEGKFAAVKGYSAWAADLLDQPAKRRTEFADTVERIKQLLAHGTQTTAEHFELQVDRPLRYSGELTTLIRIWQRWADGGEDLLAFLQRRYARIELLASTDASDPSRVAARHLKVILEEKLGHPGTTMPEALRSSLRNPRLLELVQHFQRHLATLAASGAEIDLLVTGGYKAFSLLAGKFVATQPASRSWQALYLHEDDGQLIVEGRGETWIEGGKVRETGWPRPVWED